MAHFTKITPDMLLENKVKLSDVDVLTENDIGEKVGRKKNKLPVWYAFIIYYLIGSSNKAADYLESSGIRTKRGNTYAANIVLFSVWEWMLYNLDYARQFMKNDYVVSGREFNDDIFFSEMIKHAVIYRTIMSDKAMIDWIKKNNLTDEKYLEQVKEKRPHVYRYFKTRDN